WVDAHGEQSSGEVDGLHLRIGKAWAHAGDYAKSLDEFDLSHDGATGAEAWLLATCPDAKYRDSAKALRLMMEQCAKYRSLGDDAADTLAAAEAGQGDWVKAVGFERLALLIARGRKHFETAAAKKKTLADYAARLALYEEKKPSRGIWKW
ncbi:MAG TPA: hypothetical protein VG733_07750, partial [Chthoniobacteraceae bacterium]|nr:hypothetical protein [Chthoniobacteraceae bacterium]